MHNYLKTILEEKQKEINLLNKNKKSFSQVLSANDFNIIAEIKRRSPSKGHLTEKTIDIEAIAKKYYQSGASCVSVLTDAYGFSATLNDLKIVSEVLAKTPVALLRKDFILDPLQILESVYYGANCILLIVSILQEKTENLFQFCQSLGVDALIEVHNHEELSMALDMGANMIGVNNRNLNTFEVNTNIALELKPFIPDSIISIAESGINQIEIAKQYRKAGYNGLLIGEALMRLTRPDEFIQEILLC